MSPPARNDFAKTQIVVFYVILLLAVDAINPVKMFLHVFPNVLPWHVALASILLMLYVFISEMKQMLYFSVKIFFHSILSIFFREVSIVGTQNIPSYGPVIFTGNHANQFIDSVVMLSTCRRTISYLIAQKSYNRRIVGDLAWAMGAVPVNRAQDSARKGTGTITLESISGAESKYRVVGDGTKFLSECKVKDKLRFVGLSIGLKVTSIVSDTVVEVDASAVPKFECPTSSVISFEIMERIDQKNVYEKVLSKLAGGGTIGIFPEGGSHDRTDLLPLKAGVALIAYSAMEKDGLSVPIVPVGLNYFRGHRFRGRVTVEFGKPIYADPTKLEDFVKGGDSKVKVCNEVLERIADSMRSVIVSAPDYQTLKIIHTARRLYRSKYMSSWEKQDLSRRFAEGYKRLLLISDGNPPEEWLALQQRIQDYQKELDELGIRDYQVSSLLEEKDETTGDVALREMRLPFRIAETILLLLVSALPALFLNLPVGIIARYWALHRREKALAASKVKIKGMDVMLSEKVVLCIALVPSLWVFYGLILYCFTDLDLPTIALAFWSLPLFSYMGIVTTEAGMVDLKDLKPVLIGLFPSTRCRLLSLPDLRQKLQTDLREFVKDIGPSLGELYTDEKLNWADFQMSLRREKEKAM